MNKYTKVETITKEQYYTLLGILTLAKSYEQQLTDLVRIVSGIVGEPMDNPGYVGHSSDAVWGASTVEELLNNLHIKVI